MDFTFLFQDLLENLNYWSITVLMMVESTVIPFPSEVVVPPAAYMAAEGKMDIFLVVFFATLGADLGASINYWVSYFIGRPLVYRFANSRIGHMCLLDDSKIKQAEDYFDKHGIVATLIGRLVPVIRQLISVPAGLAKMNFGYFLLFTTIGAGIWNTVLAAIGWYLQKVVPYSQLMSKVEEYNSHISIAIILFCCIGLLYLLYKHSKKNAA